MLVAWTVPEIPVLRDRAQLVPEVSEVANPETIYPPGFTVMHETLKCRLTKVIHDVSCILHQKIKMKTLPTIATIINKLISHPLCGQIWVRNACMCLHRAEPIVGVKWEKKMYRIILALYIPFSEIKMQHCKRVNFIFLISHFESPRACCLIVYRPLKKYIQFGSRD